MNSTSKFRKLAGISALAFAGLTAANAVNAANWRYAHEEYEGDVQDVYAYKFKEYIEENSDHTLQVYRFGELGDQRHHGTDPGWHPQLREQSPGFTSSLIQADFLHSVPDAHRHGHGDRVFP